MINISKQILYIDFDLTIVNSIKQIVSLYDKDFHLYENYKKVHWTEIETYDFQELELINKNIVLDYFDDHRFFENLEFMDNAEDILLKLNSQYQIYVCSLGRQMNLHYKRRWLDKHLRYTEFIGVNYNNDNKKSIDMSDGIIIDDMANNLLTSNAKDKICFGDIYDWNKDWNSKRCFNWNEVIKYLKEESR